MDRHEGAVVFSVSGGSCLVRRVLVFSGVMTNSGSGLYGLVLLPSEPVRAGLIAFARSLVPGSAPMRLGADAPPHVTVLHFRADAATARRIFADLVDAAPTAIAITSVDLAWTAIPEGDFYVPEGGACAWINVERTAAVRSLHDLAVGLADGYGCEVVSASRERFSPHVSLAVLHGPPGLASELPTELARSFPARLALGAMGSYGTFPGL